MSGAGRGPKDPGARVCNPAAGLGPPPHVAGVVRRTRVPDTMSIAIPAGLAMAAAVAVGRLGPTTTPDSVFYLGVARSLVAGDGLVSPPGVQPISGFPPLYPLVLSGLGAAGWDPAAASAWLNPLCFGLVVAMVGLAVRWLCGSWAGAGAAALLAAANLDLLVNASSTLSEPLFLVLGFASLFSVAAYLRRPGGLLLSVAAGLAAAACLTRYVGAAMVVAGGLALAASGWRRAAAMFSVVGLAPVGAWVLAVGGVNRPLAWHPVARRDLRIASGAVSRWLVPLTVDRPLRYWVTVGLIVVVGLSWVGIKMKPRTAIAAVIHKGDSSAVPSPPDVTPPGGQSRIGPLLGLFIVVYLALVLGVRLALDASARFDSRTLLPVFVAGVVLGVGVVVDAQRRWRPARWLAGAAVPVLIGLQVGQAVAWTAEGLNDDSVARRGYAAEAWRRSTVIARVAALPESVPVYSNGADAIYLLTGRRTRALPARVDYLTGLLRPTFGAEVRQLIADIGSDEGVVVDFSAITARRRAVPTVAAVPELADLEPVVSDAVGTLYRRRR